MRAKYADERIIKVQKVQKIMFVKSIFDLSRSYQKEMNDGVEDP